MQNPTRDLLLSWLKKRLEPSASSFLEDALRQIEKGVPIEQFCALISQCSRYVRKQPLAPERGEALRLLEGWNPERWSTVETSRVALVLSRPDLDRKEGVEALEEAFRYADVGELCALYKSLAYLPDAGRVVARAAEGCRSSMRVVFESTACDTPYPFLYFDELWWNQALIKCLFIEAPLWRLFGVDRRLNPELARMALDLADERRSAGRAVQHELWMCLGGHGGERAIESLEREIKSGMEMGRVAAAYGLGRAGARSRIEQLLRVETRPDVASALRLALSEPITQMCFARLSGAG